MGQSIKMVPSLGLSLESEVCCVEERGIPPQRKLEHPQVRSEFSQVSSTSEAGEPSNVAKGLTVNGGGLLKVTVGLVKKDRIVGRKEAWLNAKIPLIVRSGEGGRSQLSNEC